MGISACRNRPFPLVLVANRQCKPEEAQMSVQNTQVEIAKSEIAKAKLVVGLVMLAVMAGSCAPSMVANAPVPVVATASR